MARAARPRAAARRYKELPHPFALEIPLALESGIAAGEPILLGINLIGPAIGQMPFLIQAMQIAGQHGAGLFAPEARDDACPWIAS